MKNQKLCLIIRDGWGSGKQDVSDAIHHAETPNTDRYESEYPTVEINTSGLAVGLPEGNQGNSEVGHLNIGAGRVVYQSLTRIDNSIEEGSFFDNAALKDAIAKAKTGGSTLHLIGLIQEEGVHAVTRHCHAILDLCKRMDFSDVLIHVITDGRDTPPKSAESHIAFLKKGMASAGIGRIATVTGRYFAMDRDNNWDRTELAYRALMSGEGKNVSNVNEAIADAYAQDESDEFIKPRIIDYNGIGSNDSFIFFNFRFDRTRQLTKAIVEPGFDAFETITHNLHFVAMTHYYDDGNFIEAFPELQYKNILGEVLQNNGCKQLRCAETEKYAHVTFFFNALSNDPFEGESRILVNSPKVATYDLQPEMSAEAVTEKLLEAIDSDQYDVIICNYANCDMVGHTGIFPAVVKAVETVDRCVGRVVDRFIQKNGTVILTADHGNAEKTKLDDGSPMTAHTTNPVPFTLVNGPDGSLREGGSLCDIAPTMLDILNIPQPEEMTGMSLLVRR